MGGGAVLDQRFAAERPASGVDGTALGQAGKVGLGAAQQAVFLQQIVLIFAEQQLAVMQVGDGIGDLFQIAGNVAAHQYAVLLVLDEVQQQVPNKRYTPEFKKMVVETMKKEHLSIYAAMQEFGINDHKIIERWERIYLEEGPEALSVERRGRSSTGRSKKLPKEVEEDLLTEVQRLRAENDYLKNLQALVLEDERRQHKKRW